MINKTNNFNLLFNTQPKEMSPSKNKTKFKGKSVTDKKVQIQDLFQKEVVIKGTRNALIGQLIGLPLFFAIPKKFGNYRFIPSFIGLAVGVGQTLYNFSNKLNNLSNTEFLK